MSNLPDLNVTVGDVRWTLRDSASAWAPQAVTPYLKSVSDLPGVQVLKQTMVRTTVLARPPAVPAPIIIKAHRSLHWTDKLKHLLVPSKARREWTMAHRLASATVPTITPIAFGERSRWGFLAESCLICEALPDVAPLAELLSGALRSWPPRKRTEVLKDLALMIRRMHAGKIVHNDLHLGNVLCQLSLGGAKLFIADLHATRAVSRVTWRHRRSNLVRVMASLKDLASPEEREAFLGFYATGDRELERFVYEEKSAIGKGADGYVRWYLHSRTVRCLERGSEFDVQRLDGLRVYFRRDFSPDMIREALRLHAQAVEAGDDRLVKASTRGCVTMVQMTGGRVPFRVCVKESRRYGWRERIKAIFLGSEARRVWLAGNGLRVRQVPSCELLAAGERRRLGFPVQSFVVMKAIEGCVPLEEHVHARLTYLGARELRAYKRAMSRAVGRFLAQLHEKRIFHADLKPANILVREGEGGEIGFVLVDLDRVTFDRKVSSGCRARNLAQLDSAFQHRLEPMDRMCGYLAYCSAARGVRNRRSFLKRVQAESERLLARNRAVLAQRILDCVGKS